jgi:hypothetical protein
VAGEGRERPGRQDEPTATATDGGNDQAEGDEDGAYPEDDGGAAESPDAVDSAQATAVTPEVPARPVGQTVARPGTPAEPVLRILPLGSGLVLIGLGLGLAFIGLRLRRS